MTPRITLGGMTRNRQTARQAGARFERLIADTLAGSLGDPRIDRLVKTGNKDRGDVANVMIPLPVTPPDSPQDTGGVTHIPAPPMPGDPAPLESPGTDTDTDFLGVYEAPPIPDPSDPRRPLARRLAVECKDLSGRHPTPKHLREAETERINYGALACCVVSKRAGITAPLDQLVTMRLRDLIALLSGQRPKGTPKRPDVC